MAAATIVEAHGDFCHTALAVFERRLAERFGRGASQNTERHFWPSSWRQSLARWLLATRWFTKHIVIDRWFLHVNQAPLEFSPLANSASQ